MRCTVYWLSDNDSTRLGIMPRPRGGDWLEDEIASLRDQKVDVVVSLLTCDEEAELQLAEEPHLCRAAGLRFISFPIADRQTPADPEAALQLVHDLSQLYAQRKGIVIHCRAGIGRASLIAAAILASQGSSVMNAFQIISSARGCPVPDTEEQSRWLQKLFQNYER
jgi:protein-tyrosine phosphatase